MINIYFIDSLVVNDEILFKAMHYLDSKLSQSINGIQSKKDGKPIESKWGESSLDKPLGDWITYSCYGLASKVEIIASLRKFAPNNIINPLVIDGRSDVFALLQPKNHGLNDTGLEHLFIMFSKYKGLLVTQLFKDEWERRGLTGAEFTLVTEMDDDRFIAVQ